MEKTLAANITRIKSRIRGACARAGRSQDEVMLVAVTKTRSVEEIAAACACGLRQFGENRVEEGALKAAALLEMFPDDPPIWHMIGHVQGRKARQVAESMNMVHSVDSLRLAQRLDRFVTEIGRAPLPVLLEVNVSGEEAKDGLFAQSEAQVESLISMIVEMQSLGSLDIRGLMTMAPLVTDAEGARPVFQALRELRDLLRIECAELAWNELSMGMTNDFEVAIEEGATMVRIGRAIFGPRQS